MQVRGGIASGLDSGPAAPSMLYTVHTALCMGYCDLRVRYV